MEISYFQLRSSPSTFPLNERIDQQKTDTEEEKFNQNDYELQS